MVKFDGANIKDHKYRGWVTITHVIDGVYTSKKEYKSWDSYFDLVKDLVGEHLVEFKISVDEKGYRL